MSGTEAQPDVRRLTRWSGVAVMVLVIGTFTILEFYRVPIPHPVPFLFLGVLYATVAGGTVPGLVCAAILAVTAAYHMSKPGELFRYTPNGLANLLVITAAGSSIALVVGGLRRRSIRARDALRAQAILQTQLSERSRIQRSLQQERYEQQTIFHSVPAMIWFKDKENRILRVNALAASSIGRKVEEVEGRKTAEFYPDEADKYHQDDLEVIRSERPKLGIVEPYRVASGEKRWIRTDKIPYRDANGNIVGVIVFSVDITAQRRAQESMQQAHDELEQRVQARTAELTKANENLRREIAERQQAERGITERTLLAQFAADVGAALTRGRDLRGMLQECCEIMVWRLDAAFARIWILNDDAHILQLQASAGMYTHIDGEHSRIPVGKLKVGLIAHERKPHLTNNVVGDARIGDQEWAKRQGMAAFAGYPLLIGEQVIGVMALFARKPLSVLVTDAMGSVADMLALGIERQRTSFALQQHAGALEEANQALRTAEEAAQAANRAKSRFLANISHEIRTPIMAMLGAAELLGDDPATLRQAADRQDMILRNGRHLLSLIDELLDISRIEAGKLGIRLGRAALADVVADVNATTELLRRSKALDYQVIYETAVPAVILTDRKRLTQALINLVNNALKFTERGHVHVRIRVDHAPAGGVLTVTVEDTGPGIRPEHRESIFETFAQLEPPAQGFSAGAGLGLPIARWIAQHLGGSLEVESEVGRGSRFILRTSVGPLDGVPWLGPEQLISNSAWPTSTLRLHGRVLLAEDAHDIRELIAFALRRAGAEVVTAENGRQAVDLAASSRFDLILLDLRMPEMDGIAAAAQIRRAEFRGALIALTASAGERERGRMLEAGFDDVWAKPISLNALIEQSASYLSGVRAKPVPLGNACDGGFERERARERFNAAVSEFVDTLPKRVAGIRAALENREPGSAKEILHQLVGAGGLHGFSAISKTAARLLAHLRNGGASDPMVELQVLERLVSSLTARDVTIHGD
jgi:PAS domain S-box-containing protein